MVPAQAQDRAAALASAARRSEVAVLRAAVEAGPDGMVIAGSDGRILARNDRFTRMWPIPAEVVAGGSDDDALQSVLDKLVDPDGFLVRVRELYAARTGTSRDELHLLDGRVFDRHGSALHEQDGSYLGWVWFFRDVTEERAAAVGAARMGALVSVAQALGDASSEGDVLDVVTGLGAATVGAQGVVLCLDDPALAHLRVLTTAFFDEGVRAEVAELPRDFPLPLAAAVTGGDALFLTDRAAAVRLFPAAEDLYARANTDASAAVPLRSRDITLGSLSVAFDRPHPWRLEDRRLLEALASLTAQALSRISAQQAEQASALAVRRLAETLQRSLLTAPPAAADLQIAVRYQAAAQDAQVGGDWHDSFQCRDGTLTLVIGDVAGHDQDAAAAMAQCRNILRGVAQTLTAPPADVLSALDHALTALHLDVTATAVLCQVRSTAYGAELNWCNAGHVPPVLLLPDGTARLLDDEPDLLLGTHVDALRRDHALALPAGSTLLLHTDGLVERRYEDIDQGLARLVAAVTRLYGTAPERMCDAVLEQLGADAEDDIALLVLHIL